MGNISHASILVPYHGWRISHRTHHANHGHVENDESWYPVTKSMYDKLVRKGCLPAWRVHPGDVCWGACMHRLPRLRLPLVDDTYLPTWDLTCFPWRSPHPSRHRSPWPASAACLPRCTPTERPWSWTSGLR